MPAPLSTTGRYVILAIAFLGWLCAGFHMQITQLAGRPAAIDLLAHTEQLDGPRFHALNQQAHAKNAAKALSAADDVQLKEWASSLWFLPLNLGFRVSFGFRPSEFGIEAFCSLIIENTSSPLPFGASQAFRNALDSPGAKGY